MKQDSNGMLGVYFFLFCSNIMTVGAFY